MSTILDALSRAERERRIGQTPAIDRALLEQPGLAPRLPARSIPWPWVAGVAAMAVIALLALLVLVMRESHESAAHDAAMAGNGVAASSASAPAVPAYTPTPTPAPAATAPAARTPEPAITAPALTTPAPGLKPQAGASALSTAERATAIRPAPKSTQPAKAAVPHEPQQKQQALVPAAPAKPEAGTASPAVNLSSLKSEAPVAKPQVPASLPLVSDLPAATRQELPPIHLSGYIYSANAADRSILINGKLLREGDQVAPGLRLEQMRPDGVVFAYRDLRFRMAY